MPVVSEDIREVVLICQRHRQRVRYGILGASISERVGNPNALPGDWGRATTTMINAEFGGVCPAASWVVDETGHPNGYGEPPNPNYDPDWSIGATPHRTIEDFLEWLDVTEPGWDGGLQSTYP